MHNEQKHTFFLATLIPFPLSALNIIINITHKPHVPQVLGIISSVAPHQQTAAVTAAKVRVVAPMYFNVEQRIPLPHASRAFDNLATLHHPNNLHPSYLTVHLWSRPSINMRQSSTVSCTRPPQTLFNNATNNWVVRSMDKPRRAANKIYATNDDNEQRDVRFDGSSLCLLLLLLLLQQRRLLHVTWSAGQCVVVWSLCLLVADAHVTRVVG